MSVFQPNLILKDVTRIDLALLRANGIRGLILDVDNTLTLHDSQMLRGDVREWIESMRAAGVPMIIVSNNSYDRVKPFADALSLDFVSMGMKPLTFGFTKAQKKMDLPVQDIAVVGDQIYTDIVGGNLKGMFTILVQPMLLENGWTFKVRRNLETIHIRTYYRRRSPAREKRPEPHSSRR